MSARMLYTYIWRYNRSKGKEETETWKYGIHPEFILSFLCSVEMGDSDAGFWELDDRLVPFYPMENVTFCFG